MPQLRQNERIFMKAFMKTCKSAVILTVLLAVLCSVIYPAVTTGLAGLLFPKQADGSLIYVDGEAVGSQVVGQQWTDPRFFKGRPSSVNYNVYTEEEKADGTYGGIASGSYNYGASNEQLKARVEEAAAVFRTDYLAATGEEYEGGLPADLFTASGSGLDPHISPAAAQIQIPIVASNSGLSRDEVSKLVEEHTEHKLLGIFGEERVNVLELNLALARRLGMVEDGEA